MPKNTSRLEFRYYNIPTGQYVISKLGPGWEQEYGVGYEGMLHFHNYLEIGYCYYGKGRLIIEDRTYHYGDDMFSFIPANIPHVTISEPGNICKWEFLFVDINEFIKNEMKTMRLETEDVIRIINKRGTIKSLRHHEKMGLIIRGIIEECRQEGPYYKESIKGHLMALVIEALRLDEEREGAKSKRPLPKYIREAIDYIDNNFEQDLKISDVAVNCSISESHFRRMFEETMNMSPVEYLNYVRIKRACALMEKEDVSMEEIGFKVGFTTPSTFNRNFKRFTGTTPYKWKREKDKGMRPGDKMNITAKPGWEGLTDGKQLVE
ncbi:MAG: AraC family transcriptional regulator [Lachnospiraceae bacterium]|nr:AraC family transcriptional regulator [Lachnospiraceae bacterium]